MKYQVSQGFPAEGIERVRVPVVVGVKGIGVVIFSRGLVTFDIQILLCFAYPKRKHLNYRDESYTTHPWILKMSEKGFIWAILAG